MRAIKGDKLAQMAMTDAILFMTIMIIACAVVLGPTMEDSNSTIQREGIQQYTEDFTSTLLALEVEGLSYVNQSGGTVNFLDIQKNVQSYLVEEALLIYQGVPRSNFINGYESEILSVSGALQRPGTDICILTEIEGQGIGVYLSESMSSASALPGDRCASQRVVILNGGEYEIVITVFVWVV